MPADDFTATAYPFLVHSYIANGTSQGIYYTIRGKNPNRTVIFEYYATPTKQEQEYCHFQVLFFEANPGIVQFIYFDASDSYKSIFGGVRSKSVYV